MSSNLRLNSTYPLRRGFKSYSYLAIYLEMVTHCQELKQQYESYRNRSPITTIIFTLIESLMLITKYQAPTQPVNFITLSRQAHRLHLEHNSYSSIGSNFTRGTVKHRHGAVNKFYFTEPG